MARKLFLGLGALALLALAVWGWCSYQANKDFTPWMSHDDLDRFLVQFDTVPPGGHPNYWDNGHWIDAVEARWHDGIPEYRIRYGPIPQGYSGAWYWYINQDQTSFSIHVHEFADRGFVLLDPNSYLRPDNSRRYQGVWHKLFKKSTEAASAPAQ